MGALIEPPGEGEVLSAVILRVENGKLCAIKGKRNYQGYKEAISFFIAELENISPSLAAPPGVEARTTISISSREAVAAGEGATDEYAMKPNPTKSFDGAGDSA